MTIEKFWEEHNKRLNTIVGKLSVPAARLQDPLLKECHKELIDLGVWVDESLEEIEATDEQ